MRSLKAEVREVMEVRLADLHTENSSVLLLQLAAGVTQLSLYVGSLNSLLPFGPAEYSWHFENLASLYFG